jgi:hypothetical protein
MPTPAPDTDAGRYPPGPDARVLLDELGDQLGLRGPQVGRQQQRLEQMIHQGPRLGARCGGGG